MDRIDKDIILAIADSGSTPLSAYQITSKVYPKLKNEEVLAARPKIRNRVRKINQFGVLEEIVDKDRTHKYMLKDGAYVTNGTLLVPNMNAQSDEDEQMLGFDAGHVLVVPTPEGDAVISLDSWL